MACLALISTLFFFISLASSAQDFPHSLPLTISDDYHLSWKYDENTITFEVCVKTLGYVGFGISKTGGMKDSDIVIGWVKNGKAFMTDRYAEREAVPKLDESQDWNLFKGEENDTHTILNFWRKLKTCDDRDVEISAGTTKLIWAYGNSEPDSPYGDPSYHGVSRRGTRTMFLINPPSTGTIQLPDDIKSFDFLNDKYNLPPTDTTYYCLAFSVPILPVKNHVLMVEPVVQPGNKAAVHHMILYGCYHALDTEEYPAYKNWDQAHGLGGVCHEENMPTDSCKVIVFSWAVGGGKQYFPEHVGYPMGGPGEKMLFMRLEIHYDNPQLRNDITDSSGLRLWVSPTLRENELGLLTLGVMDNPHHVIPPGVSSFTSFGYCSGQCGQQANNAVEELKVVAVAMHTHLAGTAVRLRRFQNGEETPIVARDENYDFNFQDFSFLAKEMPFKKTDEFIVECDYKTSDRRDVTWGGLSTLDEMCLAFVYYYPKMDLTMCASTPTRDQTLTYLPTTHKDATFPEYRRAIKATEWTDELSSKLQAAVLTGDANVLCVYDSQERQIIRTSIPEFVTPLEPLSDVTCDPEPLTPAPPVFDQAGRTVGSWTPYISMFTVAYILYNTLKLV